MSRPLMVSAALIVAGATFAIPARAQTAADKATAEELFRQGRDLMKDRRYGEACEKFAGSQRLDPAVGTELNLARCYEANGQTASAWALYKDVAVLAERAGQRDRSHVASRRASDIEKRLSRMTIEVAAAAAGSDGMEVRRDGKLVDRAEWDAPIPLDPGEHTILASAPGKQPWSTKVTVAADGGSVTVPIPPLVAAETVGPVLPAAPASSPQSGSLPRSQPGAPAATEAQAEPLTVGRTQRTLGVVIGAIGIAGVATGAVFGLAAKSKYDGAHCPTDTTCNGDGLDATSTARTDATVSTILFATGGAALAGGIVLFLSAPKPGGPSSTAFWVTSGVRAPGVQVGASW